MTRPKPDVQAWRPFKNSQAGACDRNKNFRVDRDQSIVASDHVVAARRSWKQRAPRDNCSAIDVRVRTCTRHFVHRVFPACAAVNRLKSDYTCKNNTRRYVRKIRAKTSQTWHNNLPTIASEPILNTFGRVIFLRRGFERKEDISFYSVHLSQIEQA